MANPDGANSKLSGDDPVAQDRLPVHYRLSGAAGHGSSTLDGRIRALNHFNNFLDTKRMRPFDDLTEEELCSIVLFQEYGTYLSEHARLLRNVSTFIVVDCYIFVHDLFIATLSFVSQDDEFLSLGTALAAISGPKELAFRKFPANLIWLHPVLSSCSNT